MRRLLPFVTFLCLSACDQKLTGLYMARATDIVITLEVVETDDHKLTGRAEFETIGANGQLADRANAVSGAVDGGIVTIDLQPTDVLTRATRLSGTINDGDLTLDGTSAQGHFRWILNRTSQDAIQAAFADMVAKAQAKRQARETAAFIQKTVQTSLADDAFANKQSEVVDKLHGLANAFRTATAQVQAKLGQEAAIYGDGQAEVERTQLYLDTVQVSLQSNQLHLQMQNGERAFRLKADALDRPTAEQEQGCHRAHAPTAKDPVAPEWETWNTDCLLLLESAAKFRTAKAAMASAFADAGDMWLEEKGKQDRLIASARDLQ